MQSNKINYIQEELKAEEIDVAATQIEEILAGSLEYDEGITELVHDIAVEWDNQD